MRKLVSRQFHTYGQRPRRVGARYEATEDHARFLVGQGVAEYAKDEKPAPPVVAKTPTVQTAAITAEPQSKTVETVKTRDYKRRDLTAEGEK